MLIGVGGVGVGDGGRGGSGNDGSDCQSISQSVRPPVRGYLSVSLTLSYRFGSDTPFRVFCSTTLRRTSLQLSAAVTTDVMAAKATVQGNLQRDRGLRAVLETVGGLCVLVKLSPRLAWIFGLVIPVAAWGLVSGDGCLR